MIARFAIVIAVFIGVVVLVTLSRAAKHNRRIIVVDPAMNSEQIIGDGAWLSTPANYPRSARIRDIEPRGA